MKMMRLLDVEKERRNDKSIYGYVEGVMRLLWGIQDCKTMILVMMAASMTYAHHVSSGDVDTCPSAVPKGIEIQWVVLTNPEYLDCCNMKVGYECYAEMLCLLN